MAFCSNCGMKLRSGAKYCDGCGNSVIMTSGKASKGVRQQEFIGLIKKCPNCGEQIKSFTIFCPTCGFEFRDAEASASISSFSSELLKANTATEKEKIIRNYPVPNTKEDIIEFMVLASSNIETETNISIFDAWVTKINQCYTKAGMTFTDDSDIKAIQAVYDSAQSKIKKIHFSNTARRAGKAATNSLNYMPQLIIGCAWIISLLVLIPLCQINLDGVGSNASQIIFIRDLIAGAIVLPRLLICESKLPITVVTIGIVATIAILIPLTQKNLDEVGFSANQLLLIVEVICSIIILMRVFKNKNK